jgi:ACR3 family arsenite transporter
VLRFVLAAGILLRLLLLKLKSKTWFEQKFMPVFGPFALLGLLYTIIVMFAAQDIISQIGNVARVAVPMFVYFIMMFSVSLYLSHRAKMSYPAAVTQAFTAASNNFELAIAVAVATFGIQSQEALAATVGPLIEVPVLLLLVYVALWLKRRLWDRAAFSHGASDAMPHKDPASNPVELGQR